MSASLVRLARVASRAEPLLDRCPAGVDAGDTVPIDPTVPGFKNHSPPYSSAGAGSMAYLLRMLRPSAKLDEIDRRHARERLARRTYREALEVFAALWREAAALHPEFPGSWQDDLGPDLAIARALHALPPDS